MTITEYVLAIANELADNYDAPDFKKQSYYIDYVMANKFRIASWLESGMPVVMAAMNIANDWNLAPRIKA